MSARAAIAAELAVLDACGARPFDAHAHTGTDIDGTSRTSEEHLRGLEALDGRSVIFPFCVAGGYDAENERVIAESRCEPERLVPFARLDPHAEGVASAAASALMAGAKGFKLHPRAEDFRLDHAGVDAIAAIAAEARVPVLIHAGLGVGSFGGTILTLSERHRECPIVLAHAAIADLCWLWEEVPAHPNLFFDTSWWNPSDLIALFSLVPPGRILFGSDAPYMDRDAVLAITLRCARFAGLRSEQLELVVGGQLENVLGGGTPLDSGPAPGMPESAPRPTAGRVAIARAAAGGAKLGGGDSAQMFELARLAAGSDGAALGEAGPLVLALLEEGAEADPSAPWALALALTLTLLHTPGVESAVPVG